MIAIYHKVCHKCSEIITKGYSTSFASAIKLLHKDLRTPINDIYGFVRLADEIVDSFHRYKQKTLLDEFSAATWKAIENGISINPILHSFQHTINKYHIPANLIQSFLHSMYLDLYKTDYVEKNEIDEYIYGSAEVVGLMCLCVFCEGNMELYERLSGYARKLGAAFQKVNFLRDIKADYQQLNRKYFPGFDYDTFDATAKTMIEKDIANDFKESIAGIRQLPWKSRYGVYTAYRYYFALFKKIRQAQLHIVMHQRIRVPDYQKLFIVLQAGMHNRLNLI